MGERIKTRIKLLLKRWPYYILQLFLYIVFLIRDEIATDILFRYGSTSLGKAFIVLNSYLPKNITGWSLFILVLSIIAIIGYDFFDLRKKATRETVEAIENVIPIQPKEILPIETVSDDVFVIREGLADLIGEGDKLFQDGKRSNVVKHKQRRTEWWNTVRPWGTKTGEYIEEYFGKIGKRKYDDMTRMEKRKYTDDEGHDKRLSVLERRLINAREVLENFQITKAGFEQGIVNGGDDYRSITQSQAPEERAQRKVHKRRADIDIEVRENPNEERPSIFVRIRNNEEEEIYCRVEVLSIFDDNSRNVLREISQYANHFSWAGGGTSDDGMKLMRAGHDGIANIVERRINDFGFYFLFHENPDTNWKIPGSYKLELLIGGAIDGVEFLGRNLRIEFKYLQNEEYDGFGGVKNRGKLQLSDWHLQEIVEGVAKYDFASPLTPDQMNSGKLKRERDIENLNKFFSNIHVPTLYEYTARAPHLRPLQVILFSDAFNELLTDPLFHFYAHTLRDYIQNLNRLLNQSLAHSEHYHPNRNNTLFIFSNPGDMPLDSQQQRDWDSIASTADELRGMLDEFLGYVRENYVEINLDELSTAAWNIYVKFLRDSDAE